MDQRDCTDFSCIVIFFTLVLAIFVIGVYAWCAGNFTKLTTAYDPDGKGCGVDYKDYPYIYFASPHHDVTVLLASLYGLPFVSKNAPSRGTQC